MRQYIDIAYCKARYSFQVSSDIKINLSIKYKKSDDGNDKIIIPSSSHSSSFLRDEPSRRGSNHEVFFPIWLNMAKICSICYSTLQTPTYIAKENIFESYS